MFEGFGVTKAMVLALILLVYIGLIVLPAAIICRRIGRPWWFGAFALVPVVNIGLLWFVAVTNWDTAAANRPTA